LIQSIRLPLVSGKASAIGLVASFALTAALIPMAARLPLWIDFELVLALWWLIWVTVLSRLLYLGSRVSDDHQMAAPRWWFGSGSRKSSSVSAASDLVWWPVLFDAEGCAWILFIVLAACALVGVAWFVVEVAVPLVAFLTYILMQSMLARVVNDDHACRGRLLSSVARGLLWATVYTAPLAGVVWLVHRIHGAHV
jgi:hypothetical protein